MRSERETERWKRKKKKKERERRGDEGAFMPWSRTAAGGKNRQERQEGAIEITLFGRKKGTACSTE